MRHISVEPPAFFHRGPSPLARLAFFGLVSLALLFLDTRYRYLENIRQAVAVALYPLQRAAQMPSEAIAYVGTYFVMQRALVEENAALKRRLLEQGAAAQAYESARADNARLKSLLDVRAHYGNRATVVEVLYTGRDPFSQKLFVDKGADAGIAPGDAVIDAQGVVGQVTRALPYMAEVTLVTDKDQAVPVKVERSGVRACSTVRARDARPSFASCRPTRTSSPPTCSSPLASTARIRPGSRSPGWRRSSARPARCSRGSRRSRSRGSIATNTCSCSGAPRAFRRGRRNPPTPMGRRSPAAAGVAEARMALPGLMPLMPARPEEILRPVRPWFIVLTLLLALLANLLPASGVVLALRPDFLALVLLYWCIQEPRFVGVGTAWMVGLVMDVGDGTVFGQHALAYAFLAYAAEYFRRRVLRFPPWQQAAQVAVLLLLCSALVLLIRLVGGASLPRWTYTAPSLVGALLWPILSVALQWPQRPARSPSDR